MILPEVALALTRSSKYRGSHSLPNPAFLYPFGAGIIFLILAHSVYKMWIIQEPNKLALWNKLHFEEKETESIEGV